MESDLFRLYLILALGIALGYFVARLDMGAIEDENISLRRENFSLKAFIVSKFAGVSEKD